MTNKMSFAKYGHPEAPDFEYSGDFTSKINQARFYYHWVRYITLPEANKVGGVYKSAAMKRLNQTRKDLRRALGKKPRRMEAHLETTIAGIPCGVYVSDCGEDVTILDRHGYQANWLADKATREDYDRIYAMIDEAREESALNYELYRRGIA